MPFPLPKLACRHSQVCPRCAEAVEDRARQMAAEMAESKDLDEPVRPLSQRELEIAQMIAQGLESQQIGAKLWLSFHSVRTHVARSMAATGTKTRAELVAYCLRRGWIE